MKYIKYLLITLLLVPFIVLAETKNVEIKSISNYVDKSDAVEELEKPNIEGLKLGFKLKFTKQDDFIKYKFIIKNNTDKDYEIDNSSTFNEKKFIRYDYEVENNAKVLKANEELSITVTITYVKELDDSEFENGVFTETNQVSLELVNNSPAGDTSCNKSVFLFSFSATSAQDFLTSSGSNFDQILRK